jgi:HK97 gp10 family phage protein
MAANVVSGAAAFKWEGVPRFKAMLGALAEAIGEDGAGELRGEIKDALMKPAMVIRDEARDLAPVRTGNLRDSIYAAKGPEDAPGVIVFVSRKKAPYAVFVEKGTSKRGASPFFRPAVAATRPLIANMIAGDMKKLIEATVEKYAWDAPR